MNKVIIDNLLLERNSDEKFTISAVAADGKTIKIEMTAKTALEVARTLLNWVCAAWLD